jgi:hypothetical protein
VIADAKKIYQAATPLEAESALDAFAQAWDAKYRPSPRCGVPKTITGPNAILAAAAMSWGGWSA